MPEVINAQFAGDYVRMYLEPWPLKGVECSALFWAYPTFDAERVRFEEIEAMPFGKQTGRSLKRYGFAPSLGYFLDCGGYQYRVAQDIDLETLKDRLLKKWGYN